MTEPPAPNPNIIDKPFVYGTAAFKIDSGSTPQGHSHRWTVYIRDINNDSMSTYIEHVTFVLHNTYTNPNRVIHNPPYEVTETGWGEFDINIIVQFRDTAHSTIQLTHHLKLFPTPNIVNGQTIEHDITQPVMSEHYDEFVFNNPEPAFKQLLFAEAQKLPEHTVLSKYFTTQAFAAEEQNCIVKLQAALNKVAANIHLQRARLHSIEKDIKTLEE